MKIVKQLPPIVAFDPESPEDMSIGPRDVNTNERLIVADELPDNDVLYGTSPDY